MRLIRLYKNRRLYDCAEHAYITYRDLVVLLRKGIDFKIEDQRSRADCTRGVLVDVLLATAAGSRSDGVATEETLRLLIQLSETFEPALLAAFIDHTMSTWSSEFRPVEGPAARRPIRARIA